MKLLPILAALASTAHAAYWLEDVKHQGLSSFHANPASYKVFRNVKDYGAVGDGNADDTTAINRAISDGNRCGGTGTCVGSTMTPAVVYFPAGTYLISSSIVSYYYTQMIGDPSAMPVIKGSAAFKAPGIGLIDSDLYGDDGHLRIQSTNNFYRQVRNLVLDTTDCTTAVTGIHWPMAQATSIQNVVFKLSANYDLQHRGIFIEEGSGGFIGDLVFQGGQIAMDLGNQQYTARNISITGAQTAVNQLWDWGWTYKNLNINSCQVGINASSQAVGSITLLDSKFTNVKTAIINGRTPTNTTGQGSLVLEGVDFVGVTTVLASADADGNAPTAAINADGVAKAGLVVGNYHTPNGPGTFTPAAADGQNSKYFPRPKALLQGSRFYERSKPTYANVAAASVLSARSYGAAGDGKTDDTQALNALFKAASGNYSKQAIAFLDAGFYKVTGTVYVPPNTRIVGEGLAATIMGAGANYGNADQPLPVLQVGKAGESGYVEISDLLVSTQGSTPGAVLIEYNLASAAATSNCKAGSPPSGLWDVHVRVGGFQGSELQVAQCLKTPDVPSAKGPAVNSPCVAAHTSMHITKTAGNLYMENNWLWVADHDIEDANNTQITIFAARGLLIESEPGRLWLIGTAVEHHTLYQYQLVNTRDVFLGQLQTETPYYQPNPPAPFPFVPQPALADPDFAGDCAGAHATDGRLPVGTNQTAPCAMAWGLRVVDSADVVVFGAGLYSFFHNYNTSCSQRATGEACQARIFHAGPATLPPVPLSASGADARDISPVSAAEASGTPARMGALTVYNLDTVGALSMVTQGGRDVEGAGWAANFATFASTLALYVYGA